MGTTYLPVTGSYLSYRTIPARLVDLDARIREHTFDEGFDRLRRHMAAGDPLTDIAMVDEDGYPVVRFADRCSDLFRARAETYRDRLLREQGKPQSEEAAAEREGMLVRYAERRDRLEALPGWHDFVHAIRADWDPIDQIVDFCHENGKAPVRYERWRDRDMGAESRQVRRFWREEWFHPEAVARLNAAPGWAFVPRPIRPFEDVCVLLGEWMTLHGRTPKKHEKMSDGYGIGKWVNAQRWKYHHGLLTPEQIAMLEAIPGWTWTAPR